MKEIYSAYAALLCGAGTIFGNRSSDDVEYLIESNDSALLHDLQAVNADYWRVIGREQTEEPSN